MNQVVRVTEKCGGIDVVADILGIPAGRVRGWKYDRGSPGSGYIPAHFHDRLLAGAHERGIALFPSDFFESPGSEQQA